MLPLSIDSILVVNSASAYHPSNVLFARVGCTNIIVLSVILYVSGFLLVFVPPFKLYVIA